MVEKGSEVGAHILSGAVFEPRALNELFPDWKELGAPLNTPVKRDDIYRAARTLTSAPKIPDFFVPKTMHNEGNYIISLGNLCRWLAQQAENLGVEIYPGFAAQEALIDENGVVRGIITGDLGVDREGNPKEGYYTPGMELRAKYTLFAEGCRGHIGKQLIKKYNLDSEADAQHLRHRHRRKSGISTRPSMSQAWWYTLPAGRWTSWAPRTPAAPSSITWKTTRS